MNEPATEEMESSKESMRQEASGCPLQIMHTQRTVPDADASHLACDGVTRCCDVRHAWGFRRLGVLQFLMAYRVVTQLRPGLG
jgi:hypothetical protein